MVTLKKVAKYEYNEFVEFVFSGTRWECERFIDKNCELLDEGEEFIIED